MDADTKAWIRNAADDKAARAGCYFDVAAAEKVREFFRRFLRHSKGQFAGQPFELLNWQWQDLIGPLFGWRRKDGTRRFRKAYVEIPKKNGKSTLAAGVGLYMLIGDGERGAEVYSTACTRDQASIVHGEAINMVKASEGLSAYLRVNHSTKEILFDRTQSKYKALASDAGSSEGLNSHAMVIDELHAWKGTAGRAFYDSLKYAGRARRQPLQFVITTAGDDQTSVCWELHQYAEQVISGAVEDHRFFGYIRAADQADDWNQPEIWRKANPSLGETISEEEFGADLREAVKTPTSLAQFLRYSFNLWSSGGDPAIRPEDWAACKVEFTAAELEGRECYAALDLSRSKDMTALVLVFRDDDEGWYRVLPFFWMPMATIMHPATPEVVRVWERQGLIRATEGNVTDYRQVKADIVELAEKYQFVEMAFDPYFAEELTQNIADETGVERVAFHQTITNFAAPSAELERLVAAGILQHDGNPVLAWQAGNLVWRMDPSGNKRPNREGRQKKIDGLVALIMALGRCMLVPDMTQSVGFSFGMGGDE